MAARYVYNLLSSLHTYVCADILLLSVYTDVCVDMFTCVLVHEIIWIHTDAHSFFFIYKGTSLCT